ncbi:DUF3597 domain-containing protein [Methylobacterium radiodurans]|uniref:DUF3597 domain-containing protein n=1 Tax=Methylobacterium radiodurans TaxID=2202828 RepID=UPI0013A54C0E|nr:DUF3597 domain-containing protein [Methylobacterium radiodurans]
MAVMLFIYIDLIEKLLKYLKTFADKQTAAQPPSATPTPESTVAQPASTPRAPSAAAVEESHIARNNLRAEFPLDIDVTPQQRSKDQELEIFVTELVRSKRNRGKKVSGKIYRNGGRVLVYGPVWLNNILWGEVFDQFGRDYEIEKVGG